MPNTRETSSVKTSPDAGRPGLQRNEESDLDPLLDLQQSAGNQAMLRLFGGGTIQTKPNGSHGLMVQRAARDGAESMPAPNAPDKETTPAKAALIVEDEATEVKTGQMRKTEFLSLLRTSVCATAEEALAGTMWSAMGCPYIERWLDHYSKQSSTHLERALRKYAAPEAASARSAQDYIPLVSQRLRRGIQEWKTTGEVTDLPEEFAEGGMPGATVSGLVGSLLSGVGSAISGLVSGAGKALSSVGSMLFKDKESGGGARDADDPQAIRDELGDGHALDAGVKHRMQSALGADFSGVRVHSDSSAQAMSDRLNARAFTIGNDIAFGPGEYQPGTPIGDALIAHELAHVVQQQSGDVTGAPLTKADAHSGALEDEADVSAVGAVVSLWGGAKGLFGNISRNSLPRLRSGLRLQRCSSYSKSDLQKKIDKLPPVADLVTYINNLGADNRKQAIKDLEDIRIDYVDREVSPDAVALMEKALQEIYRGVAQAQAPAATAPEGGYAPGAAPAELMTGTRTLSAGEKAAATSALTPVPSGGVLPTFKPDIPGKGSYETRIRTRIRAVIDWQYADLVVGKGPAEHADSAKVFDMDRFKEIGNAAKKETDKVFGSYSKGPPFTSGVNLIDQFEDEESRNTALAAAAAAAPGTDPLKDKAKGRVSYILNSDEEVLKINKEHGAVPSRTTPPAPGLEAEATILDRAREDFATSDGTKLLEIFRGWEGAQLEGQVFLQRFKKGSDIENRRMFWDTFQTMIHEYIHSLEHDDYHAYAETFGEESEQYNTLVEGMCSVLTEIAWTNIAPKVTTTALREKVETAAFAAEPFEPSTVPDITNQRYPSFDQAMKVVNIAGIRNVYAAFFLGKAKLIGKP